MLTEREKYNTNSMISLLLSVIGLIFLIIIIALGLLITSNSIAIIVRKEIFPFYIIVVIYTIPPVILTIKNFLSGDQRTALTQIFLWIAYSVSMISVILLTVLSVDLYLTILSGIIVIFLLIIGISEANRISGSI